MLFLLIVVQPDDSRRYAILGQSTPNPGGVIFEAKVCKAADCGTDGENTGVQLSLHRAAISRRPTSCSEVVVFPHVGQRVALARLRRHAVRMSAYQ